MTANFVSAKFLFFTARSLFCKKITAILVSAKVSVFYSKIAKTFPKSTQRFYLAQTLIKT